MIAAAEQQGKHDLVGKLKAGLKLYETAPCRPPSEASLTEWLRGPIN
jgi:hypothetical protein